MNRAHYYLADRQGDVYGSPPSFPAGRGWAALVEVGPSCRYGIFETEAPLEEIAAPDVVAVPPQIEALLRAAEEYPPALALVANEMRRLPDETPREAFLLRFAERMQHHFDTREGTPYVRCRVVASRDAYKAIGEHCWIIGYRPDRPRYAVRWISSDFNVYSDPVTDFEVDPAWLAARFGVSSGSSP